MAAEKTARAASDINWRRVVAAIVQAASYITSFWFVQWVWPEGPLVAQIPIALAVEILLVVLKERLFRGDDPALGWIGLAIDAVINTGGLLPRVCRLLTFPPIAALIAAANQASAAQRASEGTAQAAQTALVVATACTPFDGLSILVGLIGGILLSVLPHRLWRA